MPQYEFYQLDVFTDTPFGGNPLAVFPHADGLTSEQMQIIAREMNLSETTFVFPSTNDADFKVRIFTPTQEMRFAGHPVVGTHWLIAHLGMVKLTDPVTTVTFDLPVGNRSAQLYVENGQVKYVLMNHQKPEFYATASAEQITQLAQGLGLHPSAILDTGLPVQVVSTGVRQLFVPVRSLKEMQSLDHKKQEPAIINALCEALDPVEKCTYLVMVFSTETTRDGVHVHARAFAPGLGIAEDPATGSANGGMGAYLVKHGVFSDFRDNKLTIISEQGVEMGRPSNITIEVIGSADDIQMVRVGGSVVPLMQGVMTW